MTLQSSRIYTYKITFEEVPYYYYGVHKEKRYNEEYWGSPVTHKWCWDFYTPKKQILEIFDYSDDGWLEAQEVEKRLIKPFYNTDKWCLNMNCAGLFSLEILRLAGKKGAQKIKDLCVGIHSLSTDQKRELGRKNGIKNYENSVGIHSLSNDERVENSKKGGKKTYELGLGIHGLTTEQKRNLGSKGGIRTKELGLGIHMLTAEERVEIGKKAGKIGGKIGGRITYERREGIFKLSPKEKSEVAKKGGKSSARKNRENNVGIFSLTKEELSNNGKKGGLKNKENGLGICGLTVEERRKNVKVTNSQRWQCCETGYISTAAGVVAYQRGKGIDTSKNNRRRIE